MRPSIRSIVAVLILAGVSSSAAAQGPLRRLLMGPPRPVCPPAPPIGLQPEVQPAPKVQEPTPKVQEPWVLQGRVVWKGELPKVESLVDNNRIHIDKEAILKAPKELLLDPTWRIDPKTKGVANVCVFVKRPKDRMLPILAEDKVRKDPAVMETPHTIFTPHVVALYPKWFDGKDSGPTGQTFILKNTFEKTINARLFSPLDGYNYGLLQGSQKQFDLTPQKLPVHVLSDIHPWARAYVWVFDHPYFAITKTDGTFTIPRVPADMEVQVMAWHESQGWLLTKDGKAMKLTKGKNTLDIEMTAK